MPYISESSPNKTKWIDIRKNTTTGSVLCKTGRSRTQYGWRSARLTQEEELGIRKNSVSGNVVSLIDSVEQGDYEYQKHRSRAFVVNDRDYTETDYTPSRFTQQVSFDSHGAGIYNIDAVGNWAISGITPSSFMGASVSDATQMNIGSSLMRQSVPRVPASNLVRFAGESRDAPAMFRAASYLPRNRAEMGGAYLNYVFGVIPTVKDILQMAETVLVADKHIRQHVALEKQRVQTHRTKLADSGSDIWWSTAKLSNGSLANQSSSFNGANVQYSYLTAGGAGNPQNVLYPIISVQSTWSKTVRQFATWEYFIPKPREIHSRLDRYKMLAEALVGEGVSPGTAWNLTPYTWLSDWFVDIGGLLHYQQQVNDNHITAVSNGFSYREELEVKATFHGCGVSYLGVVNPWTVLSLSNPYAQSVVRYRRHKRRGGNPYSLGPTWTSLSVQQWAILGALGLSRSAGVAIKR